MGKRISHWLDHIFCVYLRSYFHSPRKILKNYIKPGMTVLDVGFGNGRYCLEMVRMAGDDGRVLGVEIDRVKVDLLKRMAVERGIDNQVKARLCSESDLGLDDYSSGIDFALAKFVVHHAADMRGLFSNVHRALKPGGKILMVEPSHHASKSYCAEVESCVKQTGFKIAEHPKIIRTWSILLEKPSQK